MVARHVSGVASSILHGSSLSGSSSQTAGARNAGHACKSFGWMTDRSDGELIQPLTLLQLLLLLLHLLLCLRC